MVETLVIAVAQPACIPFDVNANVAICAEVIRTVEARVVVFPELSLTGYELSAPSLSIDDPRLVPIVQACKEAGTIALVGAPMRAGDGAEYIATLAVDATAARLAYRKMWLHPPEDTRFTPGDKPSVLEVDGWRLGLAICADVAVPQHAADTAALGIDIYVASTLYSADAQLRRDHHMRTRATDHQVWVALSTFAGCSGGAYPSTSGGSGIWAPDGTVIDQVGTETGAFSRVSIG